MKRLLALIMTVAMMMGISTCLTSAGEAKPTTSDLQGTSTPETTDEKSDLPKIDMTKWHYEEADDVYWQTGLSYAESPADSSYETMGLFVPGAYFTGTDNGDGTYTCSMNETGEAGNYTAVTAPFAIPVNTPGYSAMSAPTDYNSSMGYGQFRIIPILGLLSFLPVHADVMQALPPE